MSNLTIAVIAATGTALGAVVGGTVNGIVKTLQDRGAIKRRATVGARLVRRDLAVADHFLLLAADERKWWQFYDVGLAAFDRYEDVLVHKLSAAEVETVTQAVVELVKLDAGMRVTPQAEAGLAHWDLGEASLTAIKRMRKNNAAAYNALAKLAGQPAIPGLIHD